MVEKRRDPISKAFAALDWFISEASSDVGVRELAAATGFPPSTAYRVMAALSDAGFVQQDPETSRYSIGLGFYRIAQIALARAPLRRFAMPFLRELVAECDETAMLAAYDPSRQQMLSVAIIESSKPLRYVFSLNQWLPVHAGASGLAIMAFLPAKERADIVERLGLAAMTERTITDPAELEEQIGAIRARGYAITHGQRVPGAVGIAAPIFGPRGVVVGDVFLTIPEARFDPTNEEWLASKLLECTQKISAALGTSASELA